MASKYAALTKHLTGQQGTFVTKSFGELKTILGFPLPSSAWSHRPWWANYQSNPQARGWMDAEFEVEAVNLTAGTVRFVRRGKAKETTTNPSLLVVKSSPPAKYEVTSDAACPVDKDELKEALVQASALAHARLDESQIHITWSPAPHKRPTGLPDGHQAVYCFFLDGYCLKAGKAGPKSEARFVGQHYGSNAPSTLAKSILAGKDRVVKLLKEELQEELHMTNEEQIGKWIEKHTGRLNVLIPAKAGPHALSLVEALLHCRLNPLFEGHG